LPGGNVLATTMTAGDWEVSYPASCRLSCHVTYLPGQADVHGYGSFVEREVTDWVLAAARSDPWLAEHPPTFAWGVDCPPAEVPADSGVVEAVRLAGTDLGRDPALFGADFWSDAATFRRMTGAPAIVMGPGSIKAAHTVDEHVPVADLVRCAQTVALTAMRFCG
jgi:acetylornithine deacetylase